jgi:hypothetical protein
VAFRLGIWLNRSRSVLRLPGQVEETAATAYGDAGLVTSTHHRRYHHLSPEFTIAIALACVYLAVMSGHLESIDGLLMYWQARSLLYHHALHFGPILWGIPFTTSLHGIGLPIAYFPSLALFSFLAPQSPSGTAGPYNWALYYADPLYTVAGAPIHILVTAATAYVVGRFVRMLGFGRGIVVAAMLVFGLASPALVYARGDFAQPLDGLCSIAALYCACRYRTTHDRWLISASGLWLCWAVLTRPVEGSILAPIVVLLIAADGRPTQWPKSVWSTLAVVASWYLLALAVTLLVNWGRYGSLLTFGYGATEGWTTPLWVGLPGTLISPGRGIIWEFPAVLLAPLGLYSFVRRDNRRVVEGLALFAVLLLINAATWHDWVGGWTWGLRLLVPALPALTILAAAGMAALGSGLRPWIGGLLFLGGIVWAIPCVVTDLFAGYGGTYSSPPANFSLDAYPPIGAWKWIHHWFASSPADPTGVDIIWFRLVHVTGGASLLAPVMLLAIAGFLIASTRPVSALSLPTALFRLDARGPEATK